MNKNKNNFNFAVFVDGRGFLMKMNKGDYFFTDIVDEAMTFKRKDAVAVSLFLCESYKYVRVMKKCELVQSSKFLD